jgi:hypothetical protein
MRLHKAEYAARLEYAVNLTHCLTDVRLDVMETADYRYTIKGFVFQPTIEQ